MLLAAGFQVDAKSSWTILCGNVYILALNHRCRYSLEDLYANQATITSETRERECQTQSTCLVRDHAAISPAQHVRTARAKPKIKSGTSSCRILIRAPCLSSLGFAPPKPGPT
uniref:Uncharacterized protein n=1 Tax=Salix viminalis TaxID=40686 RepID=A0A6N2LLY6_SALVM